jgi:molybdate transport system substrate-binding protein
MKLLAALLAVLAIGIAPPAFAGASLAIAAAADLKFCMDELVAQFRGNHAGAAIDVSYGSSGNFATQIRQGAPFDLFFSADIEYPRGLAKDGFAASEVRPYARGRIVLWSATIDATKLTLADLARADIGKVAIANPQHAPYGKRAEEAMRASGVWDKVEARLVFGENIAQTAQFVESGNAGVGIIALSLALNPELARRGGYWLIPDELHQPLEQAFMMTRHGADNALAETFAEYVQTAQARALMARYGFALPGAKTGT